VLPGWFIYVGDSKPGLSPGYDSSRPFAGNGYDQCIGGKVIGKLGEDPYHCYWANDCLCITHVPDRYVAAGWYEVSAVVDGTHLQLNGIDAASGKGGTGWRFRSPGTLRNQKFVLTAGLANAFVPPWGPWSTLQCFDCHASDGSGGQAGWAIGEESRPPGHAARPAGPPDPFGPHGSGTKWSLTNLTLKTYPVYVGYGSDPSEVVTVTQTWRSSPLPSATNMCLNCHRWEVYGDHNQGPATLGLGLTTYHFSRVDHPPHNAGFRDNDGNPDPTGSWANHPYGNNSKWGISCMTCHGGARSGGIHGQNVGHGSVYFGYAGSYSGRRMLAGSMLAGVTRPSTTETGLCNLKIYSDAVDYAGGGFADNPHESVWVPGMGMANYDFESGADP